MFKLLRKSPNVIEKIHQEFNTAGSIALEKAKGILDIKTSDKGDRLYKHGFRNTEEAKNSWAQQIEKTNTESTIKVMEYLLLTYPQYKFITREAAMSICNKYNLVIGSVSQYKGFVPEKNLLEIEAFFKQDNELSNTYHSGYHYSIQDEIDKATYDRYLKRFDRDRLSYRPNYRPEKRKKELLIAAPLKDMESRGYKLISRIFSREVPDPVVLASMYIPGVFDASLYCIVTAWGDEASDENIVNQKMN